MTKHNPTATTPYVRRVAVRAQGKCDTEVKSLRLGFSRADSNGFCVFSVRGSRVEGKGPLIHSKGLNMYVRNVGILHTDTII